MYKSLFRGVERGAQIVHSRPCLKLYYFKTEQVNTKQLHFFVGRSTSAKYQKNNLKCNVRVKGQRSRASKV